MKWYLLSYDRQGGIVHVQEEMSTKYGRITRIGRNGPKIKTNQKK